MRFLALTVVVLAATGARAEAPAVAAGDAYFEDGQKTLAARRAVKADVKRAKNVILFIGDGMDPTTVAAARIFDGQTRGQEGEENYLAFERFPHLAMSKTYNTNAQVPDSAGTMSAMTTGVKTKAGVISITDAAGRGDCAASLRAAAATLGELSERAGLATGVVSTARLTHATPAAVYAHSADRDWEADADLPAEAKAAGCKDIASQLVDFPYGDGLDVAMGGGRSNFLRADKTDPEYPERKGRRQDGRDLVAEWIAKSPAHRYVWNEADFAAIDAATGPRLLALFEPSHMQYETDRAADGAGEPSLAQMTEKAIEILSRGEKGYFLMVEAGRIDHAHHAGNAVRALKETQALSEAVALARAKTSEADTLIIVTADHGHTLAFQGYPAKGNNILGLANAAAGGEGGGADADGHALAGDGKPYTTLAYANGPGSVFYGALDKGARPAPKADEAVDPGYRQQSLIPAPNETHGGQDVTIYASGPRAYLFGGVVEQNYVFHVIEDALDLRKRAGGR
ncbi:MAG: alkaline phosphatase [Amphiplicatus sp.]